jgi:hypothetical protein
MSSLARDCCSSPTIGKSAAPRRANATARTAKRATILVPWLLLSATAVGQFGSRDRAVGAWLLPAAKAVDRQPAERTIAVVANRSSSVGAGQPFLGRKGVVHCERARIVKAITPRRRVPVAWSVRTAARLRGRRAA